MKTLILIVAATLAQSLAWAGIDELDQASTNHQRPDLQGSVVLRVDERTGELSMLKTEQSIVSQNEAIEVATSQSDFSPVSQDKVTNELDREAGASSWYWYYPGYSFGYGYSFYYYGNCYNPWYNYYSWPYRYYYYGYGYY